jgi:hypothetical protein
MGRNKHLIVTGIEPAIIEEQDYGEHLFEDLATGKIYGSTPAGCYHVERLDLNNPYLCHKRKQRTHLRALQDGHFIDLPIDRILTQIQVFRQMVDDLIPKIAPWTGPLDPV